MKKKLLLKTMLLLCALVVGSSSVWADSWERVTAVKTLTDGGTFIIGYEADASKPGVIVPMANTGSATTSAAGFMYSGSTAASGGTGTINMSTVTTTSSFEVEIGESSKVEGAIYIKVGDNYIGNENTKNNCKLYASQAKTTSFTPSIDDDDYFTLDIEANNSDNKYRYLKYNTGSPRFAVYATTPDKIVIYKKVVDASKVATPVISGTTPFYPSTQVSITCSTDNAAIKYSIKDGDNWGEWQDYSDPFTINETTTIKAKATHATLTESDESEASTFTKTTPKANIAALVAGGAAGYVTLTDALVTYKNGTTAYLEDESGAIILHQCAGDLAAGDKISGVMNVTNYTVYSNLPEIKAFTLVDGYTKTSGNTVTPTEVTLATLMADDDTYNSYLSRYITIKGATVTSAFSNKNCTISQGGKSITLRDQNSTATLTSTANDVVTVTAHVAIFNSTKQIAVYEQSQIVVKELQDNAITGIEDSYELNLKADGGASTLDLSAATATSGGAVTFAVKSATQEATQYSLDGAVLRVEHKGTIVITASVAADADYKAATKDVTVNVWDIPAFTLDSKTILAGKSYTLVAGTDYDSDGAVTLASEDENIATVNNETKTITAVAVGTTNINVTFAKGTTTLAGSGVIALTVSAPEGQETMPVEAIFSETFADCASNGGNDGNFATSSNTKIDTPNDYTDNDGWTLTYAYPAKACMKFGGSSNKGSATSPSITVENGKTYHLSFKAAPWNEETSKTITVTVTGGKINDETTVTTSNMTKGQWNEFEYDIVASSTSLTIEFSCSANRFFLDEILLTKGISTTTVTLAASGYASYCSEYPLDFTTTDGYKAYYVSAATAEAVTFKPITGKIKGGQGIILYGTPSAECTLTYCESDNELADNLLVGTTAPKNIATVEGEYTNFGLSAGKFVKITSGNIPANKAYLPVKTADITAARELAIIFDDATGIDSVTRDALKNGKIYNLQGQEVKNAQKGIFIVNGKKVFVP